MTTLAHIWRHPIKSHGHEALERAEVKAGASLPWDRVWAIAHEGSQADGSQWVPCVNFSRGAKAPSLMAVTCILDEAREEVTLSHPERSDITLHPERDAAKLLEWVKPLMPENRAQSTRIIRVPNTAMTDTDFASISIANLASNADVATRLGTALDMRRWRANLWLDGLQAWEEVSWLGRELTIGTARFEIVEQITRCLATTANPETGARDADTLGVLEGLGHQEFGLYARVIQGGTLALGDKVELS